MCLDENFFYNSYTLKQKSEVIYLSYNVNTYSQCEFLNIIKSYEGQILSHISSVYASFSEKSMALEYISSSFL